MLGSWLGIEKKKDLARRAILTKARFFGKSIWELKKVFETMYTYTD